MTIIIFSALLMSTASQLAPSSPRPEPAVTQTVREDHARQDTMIDAMVGRSLTYPPYEARAQDARIKDRNALAAMRITDKDAQYLEDNGSHRPLSLGQVVLAQTITGR